MLSFCVTVKNRSRVDVDGRRLELFPACVASIVAACVDRVDAELVVADWRSDDWPLAEWLVEAARPLTTTVATVDGPFSCGRGRNEAAAAARGDALFFIDADCLVNAAVVAVGLSVVARGFAFFPIMYSYTDPAHTDGWWRSSSYGNCAMSRDVFERSGGWPEYTQWGLEDDHFFERVSSLVGTVRGNAHGLVHQWHPDDLAWKNRYSQPST